MRLKIFIISVLILTTSLVKAKEERLFFALKFGFVKGGEAELVLKDTTFNGKPAIHYYLLGRTTGLANKLYGVNDIYETIVDSATGLPLKSIRNIEEGKYKWYNETLFYHDRDSLLSQRTGWREMPTNMVDIISVFFYFINHHLKEGMEQGRNISMPTFHADNISDMSVSYIGMESIDTDLGVRECFVLQPWVDKGKVLKRSDGLKFFIAKDNKIPLLIDFEMNVGALHAILKSYTIDGVEQVKQ